MATQSRARLNQLIAEYPACGVIASELADATGRYKNRPPTAIYIQRGDQEFLHFEADNIPWGGRGYLIYEGLRGTRKEFLVAVSTYHTIVGRMYWPTVKRYPQDFDNPQLAQDIFKSVTPSSVAYLIWVIYREWYQPTTKPEEESGFYFGKRVKPELQMIVYAKPKDKTWTQLVDEADRAKKEREEAYLYPPKDMPELPGIEKVLRQGGKIHAFTSGGGLRVVRIEQDGKLVGYGEHPHVETAFEHADEDFLAGGRDYASVYGVNGTHTHYLTGESWSSSNIDFWLRIGHTFDVWVANGQIVFQLNGWTHYQLPDEIKEWTEAHPHMTKTWEERGFVLEAEYTNGLKVNGQFHHTMGKVSGPDRDPFYFQTTKTGYGDSFWIAMNAAFEAPEIEVI